MSSNNQETLTAYNEHVQEYIDGTPQEVNGAVKIWIDEALQGFDKNAKILEIGSAFGRDADYIETQGYTVQRTDATPGFVEYLQSKGHNAFMLNVLTDELEGGQDLIFADAVLLHFTAEEVQGVLGKIRSALSDNGQFAFTLKKGNGEEWSDAKLGSPRFFRYWQPEEIEATVSDVGFSEVTVSNNDPKWLHIHARR